MAKKTRIGKMAQKVMAKGQQTARHSATAQIPLPAVRHPLNTGVTAPVRFVPTKAAPRGAVRQRRLHK